MAKYRTVLIFSLVLLSCVLVGETACQGECHWKFYNQNLKTNAIKPSRISSFCRLIRVFLFFPEMAFLYNYWSVLETCCHKQATLNIQHFPLILIILPQICQNLLAYEQLYYFLRWHLNLYIKQDKLQKFSIPPSLNIRSQYNNKTSFRTIEETRSFLSGTNENG